MQVCQTIFLTNQIFAKTVWLLPPLPSVGRSSIPRFLLYFFILLLQVWLSKKKTNIFSLILGSASPQLNLIRGILDIGQVQPFFFSDEKYTGKGIKTYL